MLTRRSLVLTGLVGLLAANDVSPARSRHRPATPRRSSPRSIPAPPRARAMAAVASSIRTRRRRPNTSRSRSLNYGPRRTSTRRRTTSGRSISIPSPIPRIPTSPRSRSRRKSSRPTARRLQPPSPAARPRANRPTTSSCATTLCALATFGKSMISGVASTASAGRSAPCSQTP
jgi:hypothetical protein